MDILILGGKGMAGHMLKQYLEKKTKYNVYYTSRDRNDVDAIFLDVRNQENVRNVIEELKPDIVINAIGILNKAANENSEQSILVNGVLPHQTANLLEHYGGKLIQISTDCVFSGKEGNYKENDLPDGTTMYAKTKELGEVKSDRHLTIRTSIIGPELKDDGIGLFLWFMKQSGKIKGYRNVLWNGVTTLELAKAIEQFIEQNITGLYHLCTHDKISKYELLKQIQSVFHKTDVVIEPDDEIKLDRTLKNTRTDFDYSTPSYQEQLVEMKEWVKPDGH
ncbi:SDR family oxidoreductase [Halalkalibacter urbisdiaboli]|uniref:SDR family oxidoreductase n=1 Tax=Halalkalibacter urbisdiaboli TaxID=1960589 RepID=UPI000B43E084|nr:SDR family oxidoreductase [Halalkalibacter urbisdiaboli]